MKSICGLLLGLFLGTAPGQTRDATLAKIRSLGEQGGFSEAAAPLREILANPRDALRQQALYQLARDWMREFRFEAAVWVFDEFRRASPESFYNWMNYSLSLRQSGKNEESERVLREAIAKFPSQGILHDELGLLYQALGKDELAVEEFRAAKEQGAWDAAENLVILRMLRKDRGAAKQVLDEVLHQDSSRSRARELFGFLNLD